MKPCFSSSEPELVEHEKELPNDLSNATENNEVQTTTFENKSNTDSSQSEAHSQEENTVEIENSFKQSKSEELMEQESENCSTPSRKSKKIKTTIAAETTPKQAMSPKQIQRQIESEKKRKQKQMEREERDRKRQEEKEEKTRLKEEKQKQKFEKDELKKKEREEKEEHKKKEREEKEQQKQREREEREQKRKEKDEREEQNRKEKELERQKKQQELDEKNKEKQKLEELKQKAATVFANFFVPLKKENAAIENKKTQLDSAFMPFEVKSDMRLAPIYRNHLSEEEKENVIKAVDEQDDTKSYLIELKNGKKPKCTGKTWPYEDPNEDVVLVEETNLGKNIYEQKPKERMRAKFLKFHTNRRPAYFGTWRKESKCIKPRKPLVADKDHFDYEVDSDDDWEEEEQGESITGSDGEDKENESENEYEVDNDFFVPHGHLSEDEVDDEEITKLSPESHKAKLKLLKNEFDEEMKSKTQKIKPRVIGCIWYKKDEKVDDITERFLQPLAIIANGPIVIKNRDHPDFQINTKRKSTATTMSEEIIPSFLELVHGSTKNNKTLIKEFLSYISDKEISVTLSKSEVGRSLRQFARWIKCPEDGPMFDKYCWYVSEEVRNKHSMKLSLPNKWKHVTRD